METYEILAADEFVEVSEFVEHRLLNNALPYARLPTASLDRVPDHRQVGKSCRGVAPWAPRVTAATGARGGTPLQLLAMIVMPTSDQAIRGEHGCLA